MDSDFVLIPWRHLFKLTMQGVEDGKVFDIPKALFYQPKQQNPLQTRIFDQPLANPAGISAGPHSQLAQNVVSAWLCGARYIELKTVQTDDELEIPRPCIDMAYEGYNCEFSQELKIQQAFDQYLNAWILVHILKDKLGWEQDNGTIFNMSIGYNLEGIKKENMQWFLNKMQDCSREKNQKLEAIADLYPRALELHIPDSISDNVTLSTMHGCPPDEIQQIGEYLLREKSLHTYIKFNPTLLGKEKIREILTVFGYSTPIPDEAFEHDIAYEDAVQVIKSLIATAKEADRHFGLKLTNTLESQNHRNIFKGDAMFMSGKALHPISINVARKLKNEPELRDIPMSFSGGVDALNIAETLSCGLSPITVSSDLLRPGGYGKLSQYLEILHKEFEQMDAMNIPQFISNVAGQREASDADVKNINRYADYVLQNEDYTARQPDIKIDRPLEAFDCIEAPCRSTCPSAQDVPGYLYHTARGEHDKAFEVIMRDNPFPAISGMICDHECQTRCTRTLYDQPLLIREIKRFVAENGKPPATTARVLQDKGKIAVIGAGPSGLSCAYYLAIAGFQVEVFESKNYAGGMVAATIPPFRLSEDAIQQDIQRIKAKGVVLHFGTKVNHQKFRQLSRDFDYLYLAVGAQNSKMLDVEGVELVEKGVFSPLELLEQIKSKKQVEIGNDIIVLGGGNVAVDVARTVKRIAGAEGRVRLAYRRTAAQMPAGNEELEEALEEGVEWLELVNPLKIKSRSGKVDKLVMQRMKLEAGDKTGRPNPVPDGDKQVTLSCDTIIPAFGQDVEPEFRELVSKTGEAGELSEKIFTGGDAARGASTLINAIADGKKVAQHITGKTKVKQTKASGSKTAKNISTEELQVKKARVKRGVKMKKNTAGNRQDFSLVNHSLTMAEAQQESQRCMFCDELCNICVDVCPNRANHGYEVKPFTVEIPQVRRENGTTVTETAGKFSLQQRHQVLNIKDFCNECGNCETFCPSSGSPYRDKPQVYLTHQGFSETDEGYTFNNGTLYFKSRGRRASLTRKDGELIFNSDDAFVVFSACDFKPKTVTLKSESTQAIRLEEAIQMSVVYEGVKTLFP